MEEENRLESCYGKKTQENMFKSQDYLIFLCGEFSFFFFFQVGLKFELRALLEKKVLYHLRHSSSPFCSGCFGKGSCELFV
jgi:hypothetical protein